MVEVPPRGLQEQRRHLLHTTSPAPTSCQIGYLYRSAPERDGSPGTSSSSPRTETPPPAQLMAHLRPGSSLFRLIIVTELCSCPLPVRHRPRPRHAKSVTSTVQHSGWTGLCAILEATHLAAGSLHLILRRRHPNRPIDTDRVKSIAKHALQLGAPRCRRLVFNPHKAAARLSF